MISQAFFALPIAMVQVLVTALAARRLGKLSGFSQKWESAPLHFAYETALGFAAISYLLFAACCFHLISVTFLRGMMLFLLPFAIWEGKSFKFKWETGLSGFWIFAAILYGIWIMLGLVLPPADRDELIYQLEIPRQILKAGGFKLFSDNPYAYFPQLASMLTLLGLGGAGEIAAKLYHSFFGVLIALSLYGAARKFASKNIAAASVAFFLTTPVVFALMTLVYVDLSYTLYAFLAALILLREDEPVPSRAAAAGILTGCAAAIKYPGLQFSILLAGLCLIQYWRDRRRAWLAAIPILGSMTFLFIFPYLIRNFLFTGWPLFPFESSHFSIRPEIAWSQEQASLFLLWLGQYGTPLGQAALFYTLAAPLLVFITGQFNSPQFYEGVAGPLYLLIPFLLFRLPLKRELKVAGLFSILFLYYWAVTTKQMRFLVPVLPLLCLMLAYGIQKRKAKFWKIACVLFVLGNAAAGIQQTLNKDPWLFWQGKESRENYLRRQLPLYDIYQETNRQLKMQTGARVFLINMKNYGYYLDVPWTGDFIFERYRLDQALRRAASAEDLKPFFASLNVSHLLMDEAFVQSPDWGMEPRELSLFQEYLKAHARLTAHDMSYGLYKITS